MAFAQRNRGIGGTAKTFHFDPIRSDWWEELLTWCLPEKLLALAKGANIKKIL